MSRRIRPSARKKTLHNVMCSGLSETDKKCIKEVFEKFELQKSRIENLEEQRDVYMQESAEYSKEIDVLKADKEALIAGQETLQKALAEKNAEIERLKTSNKNKLDLIHDLRSHLNDAHSAAIKKFADNAIERVEKARQKYQRLCKEQGEEIDEAMNIHFNGMVNILKEIVGENT